LASHLGCAQIEQILLQDMSAGMHHVTTTPASITYNTRLLAKSMR
jgi:hypothetical protein